MNKVLPALVVALLATTSTIATAQIEESWPGSPTVVGPPPMAPGGVVGEYDDDDDSPVLIEDDDDDEDDDEEGDS